jgi:serine protease
VDNDNDPSALLNENHGTAAAGIIGANSNNSVGIASICPLCQIMCLRYIEGKTGSVSNQIAALDYAVKMGAQISNNGYGSFG